MLPSHSAGLVFVANPIQTASSIKQTRFRWFEYHEQNLERSGRKYLPLSKGTILLSLVMPILNAGAGASTPQVVSTTLGTHLNFGTPGDFLTEQYPLCLLWITNSLGGTQNVLQP